MPIEIRELIIEASLARPEDQGEESVELLTGEDREELINEIKERIVSDGDLLSSGLKRQIIAECMEKFREEWDKMVHR